MSRSTESEAKTDTRAKAEALCGCQGEYDQRLQSCPSCDAIEAALCEAEIDAVMNIARAWREVMQRSNAKQYGVMDMIADLERRAEYAKALRRAEEIEK